MEELKPCPFCGAKVELEKEPLWHGSHGYHDCYKFVIQCKKCGGQRILPENDTLGRPEEVARRNAIFTWNKRAE